MRRGCALIVAGVAAYGSYEHQRHFALHGGADPVSAAIWPLSVDGLLLLATVGLLKSGRQPSRRVQLAARLAFLLGIAVSLAANIAAAPTLAWQPILVAGWPPVALLLAAELLTHQAGPREPTEAEPATRTQESGRETGNETEAADTPEEVSKAAKAPAEQVMWEYFLREQASGRTPTGASWTELLGRTTTGAPCCADGASKAASHQWTQIGTTGTRWCPVQAAPSNRERAAESRRPVTAAVTGRRLC